MIAPRRVYDPKRVRIAGDHRGIRRAGGKADCFAGAEREDAADRRRSMCPRTAARRSSFWGSTRPTDSTAAKCVSIRPTRWPRTTHFLFAVERTDPKKVLFVDDGRRPRAQLYFRAALDASPDAAFQMEVQRPEQAAASNFRTTRWWCSPIRARCRLDFEDALKRYVSGGGSVLIALGPASAALPRVPVPTNRFRLRAMPAAKAERFLTVTDFDTGHPALRSVERFDGVKFYQVVHVTPSKSTSAGAAERPERRWCSNVRSAKARCWCSLRPSTTPPTICRSTPSWVPFVQQSAAISGRRRNGTAGESAGGFVCRTAQRR